MGQCTCGSEDITYVIAPLAQSLHGEPVTIIARHFRCNGCSKVWPASDFNLKEELEKAYARVYGERGDHIHAKGRY